MMFLVDLPARQLQQEDESQVFRCFVASGGANTGTRQQLSGELTGWPEHLQYTTRTERWLNCLLMAGRRTVRKLRPSVVPGTTQANFKLPQIVSYRAIITLV